MILGQEPVTLRRFVAQTIGTDGRPEAQAGTPTTILASVQPLNGKELALLPEGERQRDQKKIYTVSEIRTADQNTGIPADWIEFDGEVWEVHQVENERSVVPHYKGRIVRIQEAG